MILRSTPPWTARPLTAHLFSGLAKWAQDENGNLEIVADAATEPPLPEGVTNEDGTVTYTYHPARWHDLV